MYLVVLSPFFTNKSNLTMATDREFTSTDWGKYAQCYDMLKTLKPYRELLEEVMSHVPDSAESVLDAGCGTGTLLELLAKKGKPILTGFDNSPAMLTIAEEKLKCYKVSLVQQDLDASWSTDQKYDCIVGMCVLYSLKSPREFFRQATRCLNVGGVLIITTIREKPETGLILKDHCGDKRSDEFWQNMHDSPQREKFLINEALGKGPLAESMEEIVKHNRRITGTRAFHFFKDDELDRLVRDVDLDIVVTKPVYAQQNQLIVAKKEH